MSTAISKYKVTMRSKTTGGTDTETIEVHPGQDARQVADRIAEGYGATVEELVPA